MADFLSNREWAIGIWGLISIIFIYCTMNEKTSIYNVFKAFFVKKILCVTVIVITYVVLCCWVLSYFDLWSCKLLKDTLLYVVTASIYVSKIINFDGKKSIIGFKNIIMENIGIMVLITFIFNFYSLPFWIEMLLIPLATLPLIFIKYIDKEGQEDDVRVKSFLSKFIFYLKYCLFVYFVLRTLNDSSELFKDDSLKQLFFPTVMTAMYLPFLYLVAVYSMYEQSFIVLECISRGDKREYRYRRSILIKACTLNLAKLAYVRKNMRPALCNTDEEFFSEINAVSNKKSISYYGE